MPYQTNIPNAGQSPGLFPAQSNDNFTRLKTMISANHKFNDSAAADDGYHQNIKMLPVSVPGNDSSVGQSFVNTADASNQLWFKDAINRVFQITPTIPIYAAVNFTSNGTIRYGHNVSSVIRTSSGNYTINFTTQLPSNNYIVSGMSMRNNNPCIISIKPNSNYGDSVSNNFVKVLTTDLNGSTLDLLANFVLVCGG